MKIFSLLFLSCIFSHAFGQSLTPDIAIKIKAATASPSNEFLIDITRKNDKVKLVYSLRDSVSYRLNLDKNYHALNDLVIASFAKASADSLTKLGAKQDSMRSMYSVYSRDSIEVPAAELKDYIALLDKIMVTGNPELTNSSANASRNMRDGPLFDFKIITGKESRRVYAQYPTASTNPLLYQLITESLKIYRERKKNGFLSKLRTNSY